MSQMSQKEAVFSAVTSVFSENGVSFAEGSNAGSLLTKELRSQVNAILFQGFKSGSIQAERTYSDSELKAYVSGLQSNWIRKDKRLNGGSSYSPKNPGSRTGSSDPQLKNLRALLSTLSSESDKAEVQSHIDSRLAEISGSKAKKTVSIDTSVLPESLVKLVK